MAAFLVLAGLAAALAAAAARLPPRAGRWILIGLAVFFPASELWKQVTLARFYGVYWWWCFPFQLCSMPLYLLPVYCLAPRARRVIAAFLVDFGLLGGLFVFADQSGMHYALPALTVHSYLWHFLMIFLGLFLALTGRGGRRARDFLPAAGLFAGLAGAAQVLNLALAPLGEINMFYISPLVPVRQVVFQDLARAAGQDAARLCYLLAMVLGGFLIHMLAARLPGKIDSRDMIGKENHASRVSEGEDEKQ